MKKYSYIPENYQKKEILGREEIETLVSVFYGEMMKDKKMAIYFTDVMNVDISKHNGRMVDFWENVLFHTGSFDGNPLTSHRNINEKKKVTPKVFDVWLVLFNEVVDNLFIGPNAEKIKDRAAKMSELMMGSV